MNFETASQIAGVVSCLIAVIAFITRPKPPLPGSGKDITEPQSGSAEGKAGNLSGSQPQVGRTGPPVTQLQIGRYVKSLVLNDQRFTLYNISTKLAWLNFTLQEWDNSLKFRDPTHANGAFFPYLTFGNQPRCLTVGMWIGTADQADRNQVLLAVKRHGVTGVVKSLNSNEWSRISSFMILSSEDYGRTQAETESLILERWNLFLKNQLPLMEKAIREEEWLWETPSAE